MTVTNTASKPTLLLNEPGANSPLGRPENVKTGGDAQIKRREDAEKAAQEFETLFVDMMVKSMRQTAQPEDVSNAEDIYQGMLDSEYSKSMTSANNFGIREQILNWMEQADTSLKSETQKPDPKKTTNAENETVDNLKLQNEMWALKAASQAYQLSDQRR